MILLFLACAESGALPLDTAANDAGELPATSVAVGEVLISEVMFDPAAVDGDFGEWIELHNVATAEVNLDGVVVQDDDGSGFVVEGPLRVPAGGFVVLGPSNDTAANGGCPVDYAYSVDAVKLGNEGDSLRLTATGVPLDTFTWDASVFTVGEGSALQLDPAADAWCLATTPYGDGDLGTPGAANSPCG